MVYYKTTQSLDAVADTPAPEVSSVGCSTVVEAYLLARTADLGSAPANHAKGA